MKPRDVIPEITATISKERKIASGNVVERMKTDRSTKVMRFSGKSHILKRLQRTGDHDGRNEGKITPFDIFKIIMVSLLKFNHFRNGMRKLNICSFSVN